MRILLSIVLNALILFCITLFLSPNPELGLWAGVQLWCWSCSYFSLEAWKIFIIGWVILWIINVLIRPVLKLLSLPLFLLFLWFTTFIVNGVLLKLFSYIMNDILLIPGISYTIDGWVNFVIAVAIFTLLNMVYPLLFFKK